MGFDPNEPRDAFGKWVESASTAAGVATQRAASDKVTNDPAFRKRAIFLFSGPSAGVIGHEAVNAYLNNPNEENKKAVEKLARDLSFRFKRDISIDEVISGIDNYLDAAPKFRKEETFRGLNFSGKPNEGDTSWTGAYHGKEAVGKYESFKNKMHVGETFTDKGYMSSSGNKEYAERFTHTNVGSPNAITSYSAFVTVKDSRGVDITKDTYYADPIDRPAGYQYIMHERNSKWKVIDAKEETINGLSPYKDTFGGGPTQLHSNSKRLNVTIERIN